MEKLLPAENSLGTVAQIARIAMTVDGCPLRRVPGRGRTPPGVNRGAIRTPQVDVFRPNGRGRRLPVQCGGNGTVDESTFQGREHDERSSVTEPRVFAPHF